MAGKTLGERMAVVETWQSDHERRCEERQRTLGREVQEIKVSVKSLTKAALGVALAITGWLALQVYGNLMQKPAPQAPPTATATVRLMR